MGGGRRLELRLDAFNALNTTQFTAINSVLTVRSYADPTPTNLATDASGNVVNRSGFGAVTAQRPPREIQLLARFQFARSLHRGPGSSHRARAGAFFVPGIVAPGGGAWPQPPVVRRGPSTPTGRARRGEPLLHCAPHHGRGRMKLTLIDGI